MVTLPNKAKFKKKKGFTVTVTKILTAKKGNIDEFNNVIFFF